MRMVGRCLVCSRLISTWVSSLEPPPSTPSTPFSPPPPPPPSAPPPPPPPALSPPGRLVSTTSSGYTSLARRSKFTSVSYVSPRPITDSSFSSRSRGSLGRPALCLLLPRLSVGAHIPPVRHPTSLAPSSPLSRLSISVSRSLALCFVWPCLSHGPLPRGVPGLGGLFTPFPARTCYPPSPPSPPPFVSSSSRASVAFLLRIRLSRGRVEDRSPYLPRFAASTPLIPGFRQRLRRSIHSPVRSTIRVP